MSRRIQTPDGAASAGGDPGLTVVKGTRSRPGQTVHTKSSDFFHVYDQFYILDVVEV